MAHRNSYEDAWRAQAYAKLEFPGTYYLAYRDLPDILFEHVRGKEALDFGCGTGRSTRFLKKLGFETIGVDSAQDMIALARLKDPRGDYRLIQDNDFSSLMPTAYDLILSAFTFDNIPTHELKVKIVRELARLLKGGGTLINLVSAPEIYLHEWASFSTKDFPENRQAQSGEEVKIIITDSEDKRPVVDIVWSEAAYREVYNAAGLEILKIYRPLARGDEPYPWVNETRIAPWVIYILRRPAT